MKEHVNFYENLKEAHIRLLRTVVLYDGLPYYVFAITNHKPDGIFRIYLDPVGIPEAEKASRPFPPYMDYSAENPVLGPMLDTWLTDNPKTRIIRKQMNSPLFNKYRPFPLGMCNNDAGVVYIERQPLRPKTEQGLTSPMLYQTNISSSPGKLPRGIVSVDMFSEAFKACVLGDHPSAQTCLTNLLSGQFENEAVAFHRNFALVKGPIEMIFLAYKEDVIGVLPNNDFSRVKLGKQHSHCREVVTELKLFDSII